MMTEIFVVMWHHKATTCSLNWIVSSSDQSSRSRATTGLSMMSSRSRYRRMSETSSTSGASVGRLHSLFAKMMRQVSSTTETDPWEPDTTAQDLRGMLRRKEVNTASMHLINNAEWTHISTYCSSTSPVLWWNKHLGVNECVVQMLKNLRYLIWDDGMDEVLHPNTIAAAADRRRHSVSRHANHIFLSDYSSHAPCRCIGII